MRTLVVGAFLVAQGVTSAVAAIDDDGEQERTWLGWSVGFVPALIVIATAYLVVRRLRSKR